MTGFGAATVWLLAAVGAQSRAPAADSLIGPGPSVPFVAQGFLLCGGAAAAMVERFWGAHRVYAEDYAHLVREQEGGIRTTDLALALRRRGYSVHVARNDPDLVLQRLEAGVPAVLLLDDAGSSILHYVVLTAADRSRIHYHDPKLGPDRSAPRDQFLARWGASGYWALMARPRPDSAHTGSADQVESTNALGVESGIPDPHILAALERMRTGDYDGARMGAERILDEGLPDTLLARRILATARFRLGDADGALEDWNALSEPAIDLLDIRGAQGTRHEVMAEQSGLRPARLLTRSSFELARRRLANMPAVASSRIEYQPLTDGTVVVRGYVVETPTWPTPIVIATQATRALLDERAELEVGPFLGTGDRWRLDGGWTPAQRRVSSSLSAPISWPDAVATVGIEWVRERYGIGAPDDTTSAERTRTGISLGQWVAPHTRLDGGLWLERWNRSHRMVGARISILWALGRSDDVHIGADLEGWTGGLRDVGRASVLASALRSHGAHRASRLVMGATVTSRSAPRTLWPGAGTGQIRAPLLRGHPLVTGDVIDGAAFAPELLHATLEHRLVGRAGPLRFGGSVFLDFAATSGVGRKRARAFADVGVGVFAGSGTREAMLSLAMGARGPVLSGRVGAWPVG